MLTIVEVESSIPEFWGKSWVVLDGVIDGIMIAWFKYFVDATIFAISYHSSTIDWLEYRA